MAFAVMAILNRTQGSVFMLKSINPNYDPTKDIGQLSSLGVKVMHVMYRADQNVFGATRALIQRENTTSFYGYKLVDVFDYGNGVMDYSYALQNACVEGRTTHNQEWALTP